MTAPRFVLAASLGVALVVSACASAPPSPPSPPSPPAAEAPKPSPFAAKIEGLDKKEGLLTLYLDREKGKIWLEVPAAHDGSGEVGRFLYVHGLEVGLGSNPVGLDRGQQSGGTVVVLRRFGGRLLVEQLNTGYVAHTDNPDERRAVRESFATSVLWAGALEVVENEGRALVDWTSFVVRDAHGAAAAMRGAKQGGWSLDRDRSVPDLEGCKVFPSNVELSALLTFESAESGRLVASVAPQANAVTLIARQSFLALPDEGFRSRAYDPRAGHFTVGYLDFGVPLKAPLETLWAARHRLQKIDPTAAKSAVKKPIVFYVDSGAPEPVRSALVEGAGWWAEAFEAAGFENAYRVEVLPPGIDPLDARYNVIQWVHRSTRGWSFGGGVMDPRTGEMLNGHVSLGSQRVRHDRLLFEGLVGAAKTGTGGPDDPIQVALARIRQLAAHEVGHALGLSHNFAASTYGRASVMDYPAPLVKIRADGSLDLSDAYAKGIGAWDKVAIRYLYSEFPPGTDEAAALQGLLNEALAQGQIYLTDQDARPAGAAQPLASLWDNGSDPVATFGDVAKVRQIALANFGTGNLAAGKPTAFLEEVLAPLYFHHRYQLEAAAKSIAGLDYRYSIVGDGQPLAKPVAASQQRQAIQAVLSTLDASFLDLPESVLTLLPPHPPEYRDSDDRFQAQATAPAFDALGAAAAAADFAVAALLEPNRAARLIDLHRRDPSLPDLNEVLDALVSRGYARPPAPRRAEIARTVESVIVRRLIVLAANREATSAVRARVEATLERIAKLPIDGSDPAEEVAHRRHLSREIDRFLRQRTAPAGDPLEIPDLPPGQPIGGAEGFGFGECSWGG